MKLSLNELSVDSYATQLNEKEITQVKGGSSDVCALLEYLNSISLSPVTEKDIKPIIVESAPIPDPEV